MSGASRAGRRRTALLSRGGGLAARRGHGLLGLLAQRVGLGVRVVDAVAVGIALENARGFLQAVVVVARVLTRLLALLPLAILERLGARVRGLLLGALLVLGVEQLLLP